MSIPRGASRDARVAGNPVAGTTSHKPMAALGIRSAQRRHYPIAQIFSSVAASVAPAPLTRRCLSRALAPATRLTSRTATPRVLAMSFISELRDAVDGIAAAPRREPHDDDDTVRHHRPRPSNDQAQNTLGRI